VHDLIAHVPDDRDETRRTALVRVAGAAGLGARWPGQAMLVHPDGSSAGGVLGGALDAQLTPRLPDLVAALSSGPGRLLDLELDDAGADRAGLSCAGRVVLLVQSLDAVPRAVWDDLRARRATAVLTALDDPDRSDAHALARELLGRGEPADAVLDTTDGRVLVSVYVPTPRVVVVGAGTQADAVAAQIGLLGWTAAVVRTADEGVSEVGRLGPGDGVLVIDHSGNVDFPVLAAALHGGVGYVAALGSRRTQAARAARLQDGGVGVELVRRLRGPAGLDLGARTPAEVAVAIVAEMLAVRAGAPGTPLRDGSGSINRPDRPPDPSP
jgi:xanthine dehydrogenase accessory factor